MRRIILLLALIVAAIGGGIFLWLAFFKPTLPGRIPEVPSPTSPPSAGFPEAAPAPTPVFPGVPTPGEGTFEAPFQSPRPAAAPSGAETVGLIVPLTEGAVEGATLGANGQEVIFWNPQDSRFWAVTSEGSRRTLSSQEFFGIEKAVFSPQKDKVIISYPDGSKILFDFARQEQITLPSHWKDFSFSPDGSAVVFKSIGREREARFLAAASPDGSNFQDLATLGEADERVFSLWSPQGQIVSMFTENKGLARQELFFIGLKEEQFRSIPIPGFGFKPLWSGKGDRLLFEIYSAETNFRPNLWIVDASPESLGSNRINLFLQTFIHKCVFGPEDRMLYCAVPRDLPDGAALVPQIAQSVPDDFVKIDLSTRSKVSLTTPQENYTAENVLVSSNEKYLFFKNTSDGRLYAMRLK